MYVFDSAERDDRLSLLNAWNTLDARKQALKRFRAFRYNFHQITCLSMETISPPESKKPPEKVVPFYVR